MSFTVRRVREKSAPSLWKQRLLTALPVMLSGLKMLRSLVPEKSDDLSEGVVTRQQTLKKVWMWLTVFLIVLLLIIGSMRVLLRLKELALGGVTLAAVDLPRDDLGFTNVLLLGVGDKDHDGVDLTDTVMVASIDAKKTKSVFLLSLPRDLYALSTEKMGEGRINSLYRDYKNALVRDGLEPGEASKQALSQLGQEIGKLLGLTMHGTIKVTFSGFTEAVDLLGGVDIDVPYDIVDPEYPGANYSYVTFSIRKGMQHLDGETALKYARTRHTTSDFSRSARQQQLLSALSDTALSQGILRSPKKAMDMLSILSKNIESTFSVRELLGFVSVAKSIDTSRISGIQLSDQNGLFGSLIEPGGFLYAPPREEFDGAAVFLPVSIPEFPVTWKQLQVFISLVTQNREMLFAPVRISILNAGARSGAARLLAGELLRYGFDIVRIDNYGPKGTPDLQKSIIDIRARTEQDSDLLKKSIPWHGSFLSDLLGIESGKALPDSFTEEETADLVIVLGEDYDYQLLQDLWKK
ncbi:MAG: LCP family protein [Candidatus Peribacteraceae bacterium]